MRPHASGICDCCDAPEELTEEDVARAESAAECRAELERDDYEEYDRFYPWV